MLTACDTAAKKLAELFGGNLDKHESGAGAAIKSSGPA
jgi:hypothetical protein